MNGGWVMPAEWEPHEATWIAWPHNRTDWPGRFGPIPWVYAELVRKISPGEIVRIVVPSARIEQRARRILARVGVDFGRIEFYRWPTDRGWTRDFGPIFVRRQGRKPEVAIRRFRFNGWAKYPDWKNDDRVPERAARALGVRLLPARAGGRDLVLEGGAVDVNGRGSLLTTEQCLLDTRRQPRNPGLSREALERALAETLGVRNFIWLGSGIAGDDTHGHVDDVSRFAGPRTILCCVEENPADENYRPLQENLERLRSARLEDGSRPEIVPLPMPSPLRCDGRRLPASYANFYIANAAVLVPTFDDPKDRIALGILAEVFSDRPVVGIRSADLVWGLGAIHCVTQQQPSPTGRSARHDRSPGVFS
jgi:agmatine deiminase